MTNRNTESIMNTTIAMIKEADNTTIAECVSSPRVGHDVLCTSSL